MIAVPQSSLVRPVNGSRPPRKAQPTLLRQLNERAVFELVRRHGTVSRADLTRTMGISPPTVGKAVTRLLNAGLLEEIDGPPAVGAGRPAKAYRVARNSVQVLGAWLDTLYCGVLRGRLDGSLDREHLERFQTPKSYSDLINMLAERARKLMNSPDVTTLGLGISTPGSVDVPNQRVVFSPNMHILDGKSPSRDLAKRLGIECVMFHDTTAALLAEQQYGVARDFSDFVQIGIHQGFGVSVVSGGRLIEGRQGLAGELGHVTVDLNGPLCGCGNRGCLETLATEAALAKRISKRIRRPIEMPEVIELVEKGELEVDKELNEMLKYLAVGVGAAINIFNPAAVVLSSRVWDFDPTAFDRLKEMATTHALAANMKDCQILKAERPPGATPIAGMIYHLSNAIGPNL
jgi:N-acetylglucosamine repressor